MVWPSSSPPRDQLGPRSVGAHGAQGSPQSPVRSRTASSTTSDTFTSAGTHFDNAFPASPLYPTLNHKTIISTSPNTPSGKPSSSPRQAPHSLISPPTSQDTSQSTPFIPSAQPLPPGFYPSPQVLSQSTASGPSLPSPPPSQRDPHSPDPPDKSQPHSQQPHRASPHRKTAASPQLRRRQLPVSPPRDALAPEDSDLLDAVVEGIGRVHVTMNMDDAGRWRIKRPGGPSS